jgi:transposase IS66-like protein
MPSNDRSAPSRSIGRNVLFAGSDGGAEHWATIASLIETCKLHEVDPLSYLAEVLTRIVNGHPNGEIDKRKRFDDPLKDLGLTPFGIARA